MAKINKLNSIINKKVDQMVLQKNKSDINVMEKLNVDNGQPKDQDKIDVKLKKQS